MEPYTPANGNTRDLDAIHRDNDWRSPRSRLGPGRLDASEQSERGRSVFRGETSSPAEFRSLNRLDTDDDWQVNSKSQTMLRTLDGTGMWRGNDAPNTKFGRQLDRVAREDDWHSLDRGDAWEEMRGTIAGDGQAEYNFRQLDRVGFEDDWQASAREDITLRRLSFDLTGTEPDFAQNLRDLKPVERDVDWHRVAKEDKSSLMFGPDLEPNSGAKYAFRELDAVENNWRLGNPHRAGDVLKGFAPDLAQSVHPSEHRYRELNQVERDMDWFRSAKSDVTRRDFAPDLAQAERADDTNRFRELSKVEREADWHRTGAEDTVLREFAPDLAQSAMHPSEFKYRDFGVVDRAMDWHRAAKSDVVRRMTEPDHAETPHPSNHTYRELSAVDREADWHRSQKGDVSLSTFGPDLAGAAMHPSEFKYREYSNVDREMDWRRGGRSDRPAGHRPTGLDNGTPYQGKASLNFRNLAPVDREMDWHRTAKENGGIPTFGPGRTGRDGAIEAFKSIGEQTANFKYRNFESYGDDDWRVSLKPRARLSRDADLYMSEPLATHPSKIALRSLDNDVEIWNPSSNARSLKLQTSKRMANAEPAVELAAKVKQFETRGYRNLRPIARDFDWQRSGKGESPLIQAKLVTEPIPDSRKHSRIFRSFNKPQDGRRWNSSTKPAAPKSPTKEDKSNVRQNMYADETCLMEQVGNFHNRLRSAPRGGGGGEWNISTRVNQPVLTSGMEHGAGEEPVDQGATGRRAKASGRMVFSKPGKLFESGHAADTAPKVHPSTHTGTLRTPAVVAMQQRQAFDDDSRPSPLGPNTAVRAYTYREASKYDWVPPKRVGGSALDSVPAPPSGTPDERLARFKAATMGKSSKGSRKKSNPQPQEARPHVPAASAPHEERMAHRLAEASFNPGSPSTSRAVDVLSRRDDRLAARLAEAKAGLQN